MSSRYEQYLISSLAASGAAVLNPQAAYFLRRDLWASATDAWSDFRHGADLDRMLGGLRGLLRFRGDVTIDGTTTRDVPIVARSLGQLAQRLAWLGLRVENLAEVRSFTAPKADQEPVVFEDSPPAYPCPARDAWFGRHPGQVDHMKELARRRWFGIPDDRADSAKTGAV